MIDKPEAPEEEMTGEDYDNLQFVLEQESPMLEYKQNITDMLRKYPLQAAEMLVNKEIRAAAQKIREYAAEQFQTANRNARESILRSPAVAAGKHADVMELAQDIEREISRAFNTAHAKKWDDVVYFAEHDEGD